VFGVVTQSIFSPSVDTEMPGFTITPFFRSPFTDLTGALVNTQHYDKCGPFEMKMMECLEAYGTVAGETKCAVLIDDFNECYTMRKQQLRTHVRILTDFKVLLNDKCNCRQCEWSDTSSGGTEILRVKTITKNLDPESIHTKSHHLRV
jgi:hypothetical protein